MRSTVINRFLLIILVSAYLFMLFHFEVQQANAQTVTQTKIITANSYSAEITKVAFSYAEAWQATSGSIGKDYTVARPIGQVNIADSVFTIWKQYLFFDTTFIPSTANITSAILSVYVDFKSVAHDINITLQSGLVSSRPQMPLVATDYNKLWYGTTNDGSRSTSTTSGGYWNITLNSYGISNITRNVPSRFVLRSQEEIDGITPIASDTIDIYMPSAGESLAPKLYITYDSLGWKFVFHGPYYENGVSVPTDSVMVKVYPDGTAPFSFNLPNGTSTYTVELAKKPFFFTWNITNQGMNYSRTFYPILNEDVYVTLPDPNEPYYTYAFSINDLAGITNGYIEQLINLNGTQRPISRLPITGDEIGFYMSWSHYYSLKLTCDQGTYIWTAYQALSKFVGSGFTNSLTITPFMFTLTQGGFNMTATVTRLDGTRIEINYTDNQVETTWIYIFIKHRVSVSAFATDYSVNYTTNSLSYIWPYADNNTDYVVVLTVMKNGEQQTLTFTAPHTFTNENPWSGMFDFMGSWPLPPEYLFGVVIVFFTFLAFSSVTVEVGCFIGLLTATALAVIHWLPLNGGLLGLAWVILFLAVFKHERSREWMAEP